MTDRDTTKSIVLFIGFITVTFNLRPALTSVGPLIDAIKQDLVMSAGMAGLLITLPVLAFAVLSIFAPAFGRKVGNEKAIFLGMWVLAAGLLVRSSGLLSGLFIGTVLAGMGIAVGNVLVPGLIKKNFPSRIPLMMGVYTAGLGVSAGIASGISVPLSEGLHWGWQKSLASWAILAVLGALFWWPQVRRSRAAAGDGSAKPPGGHLLGSWLAWQVTVYSGCSAFIFYCLVTWLPVIIQGYGFSASTAGWMASILPFLGIPASFVTPILAGKLDNQRGLVAGICVFVLCGLLGLTLAADSTWVLVASIVVIAISLGAGFSLALTFLVLRADTVEDVASLSGMAQSFGYCFAAIGPMFTGFLFDLSGSWTLPLIMLMIVAVILMLSGLGAGRRAFVRR